MKPFRIYADTSVIGGVHDPEFTDESQRFIEGVRDGRFILMVSDIVIAELRGAPDPVRRILPSLPDEHVEPVEISEEVLTLRDAHVAAATVARADAIVSWNFRHIVRLDKMKAYNQINVLNGYGILTIISPTELPGDDEATDTL